MVTNHNCYLILSGANSYETLEAEEKEKIRTILFIMDRFSISLQGYHELSQVDPSLPRTHLIEGCAKNVDSQWNITKTLGPCAGAELPISFYWRRRLNGM